MSKRVEIMARPKKEVEADKWVEAKVKKVSKASDVKPKRLTIEIDPDLHIELKVYCAMNGTDLTAVVRELIENKLRPEGESAVEDANRHKFRFL